MSDLSRLKAKISGSRTVLFETYTKTTGMELVLTLDRYGDDTTNLSCTLEMCSGKCENGKTVCNWVKDKVIMSLSALELAAFSKYSNPFYLQRLGSKKQMYDFKTGEPVLKDGKPVYVTDKTGSAVPYCEKLYHKIDGDAKILTLHKNAINSLGCGITLKNSEKELVMYLDENSTYHFTKACELAMNRLMLANTVHFKYKQ